MTIIQNLENQRQLASNYSGGISCEPIYKAFEQILMRFDLKGDVLDWGAGVGNMTRRLQALGCFQSITGIDLMQRPTGIDNSINWISQDLNYTTDLPDQAFDVIVSVEVIEHLENPRAIAREWFRLLRTDGILIISTPNNESWRTLLHLVMHGHFFDFNDGHYPAHITALLRKDIERILKEAGFCTPEFFFTDVGHILGRVPIVRRFSWQTISAGLLKGLRYSDNMLALSRKPK